MSSILPLRSKKDFSPPFHSLTDTSQSITFPTPRKESLQIIKADSGGVSRLLNRGHANQKQKARKEKVAKVLSGSTFQLDPLKLALALCEKKWKRDIRPLKLGEIDKISNYHCSIRKPAYNHALNVVCLRHLNNQIIRPPRSGYAEEKDHYSPLAKFLNGILYSCKIALRASGLSPSYLKKLRFHVWDRAVKGSESTTNPLRPDLVALFSKTCPSEGVCWEAEDKDNDKNKEVFMAVEVRDDETDDVLSQAATYAYCMNLAVPARQYSIVLFYNTTMRTLRLMVFHKGGLTSSRPLDIDSIEDFRYIARLFLAMFSWQRAGDAGLPEHDFPMIPIRRMDNAITIGVVEKELHFAIDIQGRCNSVYRVSLDADPSSLATPLPTSDATPKLPTPPASPLHKTRSYTRIREQKEQKKAHNVRVVSVKRSWVKSDIEAKLLKCTTGKFGVQKHYASHIIEHVEGIPSTNHLFLPSGKKGVELWNIFKYQSEKPIINYRTLTQYISNNAGESITEVQSLGKLSETILHAMLGYLNMCRMGFQHRDVSTGNILMLDIPFQADEAILTDTPCIQYTQEELDAVIRQLPVTPQQKERFAPDDPHCLSEIRKILGELGISDQMIGTLVDGDMAIQLQEYFKTLQRHGSISGTIMFMSTRLRRKTIEEWYYQSPVDDFFSFSYVFLYSATKLALREAVNQSNTVTQGDDRQMNTNLRQQQRIYSQLVKLLEFLASDDVEVREGSFAPWLAQDEIGVKNCVRGRVFGL